MDIVIYTSHYLTNAAASFKLETEKHIYVNKQPNKLVSKWNLYIYMQLFYFTIVIIIILPAILSTPKFTRSRHVSTLSSHQRLARRDLRVPHRRQQKLPSVHAVRIIARSGGLIHQNPTRITRVRPASKCPGTRRHRFQRRRRRPLKIPVVKRIRHRSGQHRRQVYYQPVYSDVAVRRRQRRRLRPVNRLVKRPRALTRTLCFRVPDPNISNPTRFPGFGSGRPVWPTSARAETVNGDVFRR